MKRFGHCDLGHPTNELHDSFSVCFEFEAKNSLSGPAYNWNIDRKCCRQGLMSKIDREV